MIKEIKIEKAEGSRGGHIIGHTKSGKPIYANSNHPSHASFTSEDHKDAMKIHRELSDKHGGEKHDKHFAEMLNHKQMADRKASKLPHEELKEEYRQHLNKWKDYKPQFHGTSTQRLKEAASQSKEGSPYHKELEYRQSQARRKQIAQKLDQMQPRTHKSFDESIVNALAKSEGSRGGHIIGHTKSGKPIYANPYSHGHEGYTKEDHQDAYVAHRASKEKTAPLADLYHYHSAWAMNNKSPDQKKHKEAAENIKRENSQSVKKSFDDYIVANLLKKSK